MYIWKQNKGCYFFVLFLKWELCEWVEYMADCCVTHCFCYCAHCSHSSSPFKMWPHRPVGTFVTCLLAWDEVRSLFLDVKQFCYVSTLFIASDFLFSWTGPSWGRKAYVDLCCDSVSLSAGTPKSWHTLRVLWGAVWSELSFNFCYFFSLEVLKRFAVVSEKNIDFGLGF